MPTHCEQGLYKAYELEFCLLLQSVPPMLPIITNIYHPQTQKWSLKVTKVENLKTKLKLACYVGVGVPWRNHLACLGSSIQKEAGELDIEKQIGYHGEDHKKHQPLPKSLVLFADKIEEMKTA